MGRVVFAITWALFACSSTLAQTTKPRFTPPPKGAIVLFAGHDTSQWRCKTWENNAIPWTVEDGALVVKPDAGDVWTKEDFHTFTMHVEFRTPQPTEGDTSRMKGNSGVFLIGQYEIQISDSPGVTAGNGDCGAIYSLIAPSKNVALAPMEWQSYDIIFGAPKFEKGKKVEDARLTLIWNGVKVHDNVKIPSPTQDHKAAEKPTGPIVLQDKGYAVQFRNIWILPVK